MRIKLIIRFTEHVKEGWWRKEGHKLSLEDLEDVLKAKPETLVIGTGYMGLLKVPQDISDDVRSRNIELVIENTELAWQTFNRLCQSEKNVVAAFHLTC